ncbi:hypothetical protein BLD25_01925 [Candidatus Gracilibacteria bacterium GN02-872]|nr:hypothetical protein BLD25_01925 [Candidatus Gracilibacteria bacterium GN02-872]RKW20653.1 MAG: hypothetical protein D8B46_09205 [Candidatus Gracilibacteria bacterium]
MGIKETLQDCRNSKKCRMWIIGILMVIVLFLIFFWKKATTALWIIFVLLAIAMGLEGFNYDVDLGKLWETGNYKESRVESVKDKNGNTVRLIGSCVKADVNCNNFTTQAEAQKVYDTCMNEIKKNNKGVSNPKSLDIYGLDKDKDGIACESLPKTKKKKN